MQRTKKYYFMWWEYVTKCRVARWTCSFSACDRAVVTEARCDWNGVTFGERKVKLSGHHYDTFAARCAINDTRALFYVGHVHHLRTGNRYIRTRMYPECIPFRRCFTATCAQKLLTSSSFILDRFSRMSMSRRVRSYGVMSG